MALFNAPAQKLLLCTLMLVFASALYAQTHSQKRKEMRIPLESYQPNLNQFKIAPLRFVDPWSPGVELSYERLHGYKFSSQISVAYLHNTFGINKDELNKLKGIRIAFEEKIFFRAFSNNTRKYFSGELAYHNSSRDKAYFGDNFNGALSVYKKAYDVNVKSGVQYTPGNFVIDFGIGLGIKYKDVSHSSISATNTDPYAKVPEPKKNYNPDAIGKYFAPNLPVSLRVGYTF